MKTVELASTLTVIVAAAVLLNVNFVKVAAEVECYKTSSRDGQFPGSNMTSKVNCTSPTAMCYKQRLIETTEYYNETKTDLVYYWDCTDNTWPIDDFFTCGETIESTRGHPGPDDAKYGYTYYQGCTCCGDLCNDEALNGECNEFPVFKKKCYTTTANAAPEPKIEINSVDTFVVSCTETQACYKSSRAIGPDADSSYQWGCTSLPANATCGSGIVHLTPGGILKVCTCCDPDNCNGPDMDGVVADDEHCDIVIPSSSTMMTTQPAENTTAAPMTNSTTKAIETTTAMATNSSTTSTHTMSTGTESRTTSATTTNGGGGDNGGSSDNSAAIVGGVLGTFLALALIAIGVLSFMLYRVKKAGGDISLGYVANPDKIQIIED